MEFITTISGFHILPYTSCKYKQPCYTVHQQLAGHEVEQTTLYQQYRQVMQRFQILKGSEAAQRALAKHLPVT